MKCNLVVTFGLSNQECCLIHHLCEEKCWGSERIMKLFSNESAHVNSE